MEACLFCKIIAGEIPSKREYEDEQCVAFHDIHPKERVHLLVVPRKHIPTIADITDTDSPLIGHLTYVAKELAAKLNSPGYKLQWNVGKEGGQEVFHIHLHLMGK
ncbi:histidine triad nucleotide-binding protein [Candidatus Peregrinibacteria bacterium CG11_big_fil_rev_8_21_14_0_20_46_8]|nr:MAG: histidine triad nucleotide-binding protein [Candidatus Peregrinibacteria bacterium CG11_big_fil_rev_8_21_14_0_20_46_8]